MTGSHAREQPADDRRPWLHPASGLGILGLDWLIFGGNAFSAGVATPLWLVAGFGVAAAWVYFVQRRFGHDGGRASALKAALAGVVVGTPLPIAGTALATWVLTASGLKMLAGRLSKR